MGEGRRGATMYMFMHIYIYMYIFLMQTYVHIVHEYLYVFTYTYVCREVCLLVTYSFCYLEERRGALLVHDAPAIAQCSWWNGAEPGAVI